MDIKKRFKNPIFVVTFLTTLIAFIYQILGIFGVVPTVSEDEVTQIITLVVNMLAGVGVLVDPTTKGLGDN